MKKICVYGFNFRSTSVEEREGWSLPKNRWGELLNAFRDRKEVHEVVYLTTCNRSELYLVADSTFQKEQVHRIWSGICSRNGNAAPFGLVLENKEAIGHLFRVTASLDSMVVGETEVLGQVKEAYHSALDQKTTGPWLNRVFQQALAKAKTVRTKTGIGKLPVSISTVAVKLAEKIFGDLKSINTLILGAGEMGRQTAKLFLERGVEALWISNRTASVAEGLAKKLGGKTIAFEQWNTLLPSIDVVISCTSASLPLITKTLVQSTLTESRKDSLFFVDLGVPRDVEAGVGDLEGVYVYNIDDLQSVADTNQSLRQEEAKEAERLLSEATEEVFQKIQDVPKIVEAQIA